jgi:hypothetical protein
MPDVNSAPTVDLARIRSVWQILRTTLALYGDYPWLFFVLALAVMAPWDLIRLAITGVGPLSRARHEGFIEWQSLDLLTVALIDPLISALHVHAVVTIGEGQRPRLGSVASSSVRAFPAVAAAALIAGVGIEIGFFAFVIPGVVLWVRWSVVAQSAAIEQEGVGSALRRSWYVTRRCGWHVLGLLVIIFALAYGALIVGHALIRGHGASAWAVPLGIGVNTIIASFTALTTALLYFDLLAREGEAHAAGVEPGVEDSPGRLRRPLLTVLVAGLGITVALVFGLAALVSLIRQVDAPSRVSWSHGEIAFILFSIFVAICGGLLARRSWRRAGSSVRPDES